MRPLFKKMFAVAVLSFALGYGANLTFEVFAASPESGSFAPHCQRHGHNDSKRCPGEARWFGGATGYERYEGSFTVTGHRHGGSEIETIYCMGVGSDTSCNWFHQSGSGLGAEQGCSTPSNDGCSPYDYTYQSGNFSNFGNPNAPGAVYTLHQFVKDAEVTVTMNYTAIPIQEPEGTGEVHLGCVNSACALIQNGYPGQPDADGCTSLNANCGAGTHFACSNGACVSVPNGYPGQGNDDGCTSLGQGCGGGSQAYYQSYYQANYPPQCNPPHTVEVDGRCVPSCGAAGGTTCDAAACSGETLFEAYDCATCCNPGGTGDRFTCRDGACVADPDGPYAGSDCAGSCGGPEQGYYQGNYQGNYQGYYQGNYQNYYQSYYEASYSHAVCSSDGACAIVSGKGANQCGQATDCPQPPPVCSLTAVPSRVVIPPAQNITLTWSCYPPVVPPNCSISNIGQVPASGSLTVRPTSSLTYSLTCSNAAGTDTTPIKVRVFTGEPGSLKEIPPAN